MRHFIMVDEQIDIKVNGQYVGTDEIELWESCEFFMRPDFPSFKAYLESRYPDYQWELDDGDDWDELSGTDYCQYVAYLNPKRSHELLASYKIDKL